MRIQDQLFCLSALLVECSAQWPTSSWTANDATTATSSFGSNNAGSKGQWWDNGNSAAKEEEVLNGLVDEFRQHNQIRGRSDLALQTVVDHASSFFLDGQRVSLHNGDLEPLEILAPNAALFVDGFYASPASLVYTSKADADIRVTMERNTGKLFSACSQKPNGGRASNVARLKNTNSYVSYTSDDIDEEMLAKFTLEEAYPPADLRARRNMLRTAPTNLTQLEQPTARDLQATCSNYEVIEVSVVVDSSLCAEAGSAGAAESMVQSVIADTSVFYEVPGLCVKLKLLNTYIFCNSRDDPIRSMLSSAGTSNICSSPGNLLESFTGYVDQENIPGDVVHLFHAKDFTGTSTVGCAWVGTLCRDRGFNAGVNEMSFSSTPSTVAKLLAHENGHICGGSHTSDRNDIMYGSICPTCASGFGSSSISSIARQVAQTTCTSTETAGSSPPPPVPVPQPVPVPAPVPVPQPVPVPAPVPVPQPFPVPAPVPQPVSQPPPVPAPTRPAQPTRPTINWGNAPPRPTVTDCQDSASFSFTANGRSVGCVIIPGLPSLWQDFVCGYSFIANACRKSCGQC